MARYGLFVLKVPLNPNQPTSTWTVLAECQARQLVCKTLSSAIPRGNPRDLWSVASGLTYGKMRQLNSYQMCDTHLVFV